MPIAYCTQWNRIAGAPIEPIDEAEARRRWQHGPWFSVVLDGENGAPAAVIESEPGAATAKVFFFTEAGSVWLIYHFATQDGRLFLTSTLRYEYADDELHLQPECTLKETIRFTPGGDAHRELDDKSQPSIATEDWDGIDVSDHWEPIPEFGNWSSLARLDRGH